MYRVASAFCLAGWIGFVGILALRLVVIEILGGSAMTGWSVSVFAALLIAIAGGLFVALIGLNCRTRARVERAEILAASLLTALFAFQVAGTIGGAAPAATLGDSPGFYVALAFTFAALLFDHAVADVDDPEAERAYRELAMAFHAAEDGRGGVDRRRLSEDEG